MKRLKPDYDPQAVLAELVSAVCDYFGRVFDDEEQERHMLLRGHRPGDVRWTEIMQGDPTIRETAEHFGITGQKVKKLLVTGGYYDTEMYREITGLREEGGSPDEIAALLKIKPVTVRTYLPYERVIYNLEERSVNADRLQRFKKKWGRYKKGETEDNPQ